MNGGTENGSISNETPDTILVVDDDPGNLAVISALLKDYGFRVLVARDGQSALEKAHYGKPDLILLDLLMPKINGFQACAHLKSDEALKDIPVIFMTSLADIADKVRGFQTGAVDYITKPFQPEEVLARVRTHLRLRDLTIRLEQKVAERTEELMVANQKLMQEITERKQAEASLKESEKKYRLLVANAGEAIFIAQDEVVKFPNPKTLEMSGYTAEELSGIPLSELVHPAEREMVLSRYLDRLGREKPPESYRFRVRKKSGEVIWVQMTAATIVWEGRPGALCFLRDVTDERKLEEQLIRAQKMEIMGTLASGIAHDFNNILSAIIGYTELALTLPDIKNEKLENYLKLVLKAGNRAKDLSRRILSFSRQDSSEFRPTPMKPILKEVVKLIQSTLPATITINKRISVDFDIVSGDATQIHQVIMNLCTNAFHAMREKGGTLTISLDEIQLDESKEFLTMKIVPGDYLRLTVADTGVGIDPESMERIFEPYFTTKKVNEGSGLGLSVTYGIMKSHNGLIEVSSILGQGTVFHAYFPFDRKEAIPAPMPLDSIPKGNGEKLLVVDDEVSFLDVIRETLEGLNYQVHAYQNSTKALEFFLTNPDCFSAIIIDQTMPEVTGLQFVEAIRSKNKKLPVILCTGYSDAIPEASAEKLGVSKLVLKPISRQDIASAVYDVLSRNINE